jgi:hypothetical protein
MRESAGSGLILIKWLEQRVGYGILWFWVPIRAKPQALQGTVPI